MFRGGASLYPGEVALVAEAAREVRPFPVCEGPPLVQPTLILLPFAVVKLEERKYFRKLAFQQETSHLLLQIQTWIEKA